MEREAKDKWPGTPHSPEAGNTGPENWSGREDNFDGEMYDTKDPLINEGPHTYSDDEE